MSTIDHDGYTAVLEPDVETCVIHGRVLHTKAVLTFEADTLEGLRPAFADTIADYRDWCAQRGVKPAKPYSGTLSLRLDPESHRRVAEKAALAGESLNKFIQDRLREVA